MKMKYHYSVIVTTVLLGSNVCAIAQNTPSPTAWLEPATESFGQETCRKASFGISTIQNLCSQPNGIGPVIDDVMWRQNQRRCDELKRSDSKTQSENEEFVRLRCPLG